jgi:hypothetical protein
MDGRHVQDVEAHGGDLRQQRFDIGEGAVTRGIGRGRAGEELVPAGETGALAIDPEMQLLAGGGVAEVGVLGDELLNGIGERVLVERRLAVGHPAERGCDVLQMPGVGSAGACGGLVDELRADVEGERDVLWRQVALDGVGGVGLRVETLAKVGAPGIEVVDPGLDGEDPGAEAICGEASCPHVVGKGRHGGGAPVGLTFRFIEQPGGDMIMAVRKDGGGDFDLVAQEATGGIAAAVDLGLDLFDDNSVTAFFRFHSIPFDSAHCLTCPRVFQF